MAEDIAVCGVANARVVGSVVQAGTIHCLVAGPARRHDLAVVPRQLPPALGDFTGRIELLDTLDGLLAPGNGDVPGTLATVVIEGPAGVGKTTLAVQWAHRAQDRFADGTLFADLGGYGPAAPVDPGVVLGEFLFALGIREKKIPTDVDAQVALYRSVLAGRRVLVLLDNVGSPEQVRPLLAGGKDCLVMVTSRSGLAGLSITDAPTRLKVGLFSQSESECLVSGILGPCCARAESDALAELVRLCERLPLALRIAASRIATRPYVSVGDVVDDVRDDRHRLAALSGSGDARSALRDVFAWSYARLPGDQAQMFRLLGLHPGREFGVHAAAAVAGVDVPTACRLLDDLADIHLVEPVGRNRYQMHDLLNAYAAERADSEEDDDSRRRSLMNVLAWYAHVAAAADDLVFPGCAAPDVGLPPLALPVPLSDRPEALAWLHTEQATVLTALSCAARYGFRSIAVALACSVRFLTLRRRALWTDRLTAESLGLEAARACENLRAEAFLLMRRGDTHQLLGRWAESDADFEAERALARVLGDRDRLAEALCGLGRGRKLRHRYAEAWNYYHQARQVVRGANNTLAEAVVHCNLSQICGRLGRHRRALDHAQVELVLRRRAGDRVGEAYALWDAAVACQGLESHTASIGLAERAIAMYRELGASEEFLAMALETAAVSYKVCGNIVRAEQSMAEASALFANLGDPCG